MTQSRIQHSLFLALAVCLASARPLAATTIYATDVMHTIYAIDPDAQTIAPLIELLRAELAKLE